MRFFLKHRAPLSAPSRVRLGVCLGVACAALVAASSAAAATPTMVTGAGYTTNTGLVVLHARTTGAPDQYGTAPAAGFIRVSSSWYFGAAFTGTVTCIGSLGPGAIAVSGVLSRPYVGPEGFVSPNFTFLIRRFPPVIPNWYAFFVDDLSGQLRPHCGAELFLLSGLPGDPHTDIAGYLLQYGNFIVR
jgi:hypothetical protein